VGDIKSKMQQNLCFSRLWRDIISETFKIKSGGRGAGRAREKQVFAKPIDIGKEE